MIKKIYFFCVILSLFFLVSCTTVRPTKFPVEVVPPQREPFLRKDIVHIVAPGETLWRISKMYNIPMQDIISANNLPSQTLEKGQRLFIPNAGPPVPVIPLYPSLKWKYIVIHHSATDEGSSLDFDKYHFSKGWDGIGYHFVINNGTRDKLDGQIEVSPRWLKQQDGSHCKAQEMNKKGIGICLVGNFNRDNLTDKQLESLVYLVNILRRYYRIPLNRIIGHRDVKGSRTDCPGKKFPWKEFYRRLQTR